MNKLYWVSITESTVNIEVRIIPLDSYSCFYPLHFQPPTILDSRECKSDPKDLKPVGNANRDLGPAGADPRPSLCVNFVGLDLMMILRVIYAPVFRVSC